MNSNENQAIALDPRARSAIIRTAAGALFVGMLLGIGASAVGRPAPAPAAANAAPATPYSADHARITETAAPIPTF
jgi:hypothetical protein